MVKIAMSATISVGEGRRGTVAHNVSEEKRGYGRKP